MAKPFEKNLLHRIVNPLMMASLRAGMGPERSRILVTRGRRSGKRYETPVNLLVRNGQRYLVSPYGTEGWARNARAAGKVTLLRRGQNEEVMIVEAGPEEAAPVLKQYLQENRITKAYFDADVSADDSAFLPESPGHPVFRITSSKPVS